MILPGQPGGKVGHRHDLFKTARFARGGLFWFCQGKLGGVEVIVLATLSLPPLTALIHEEKLSDGSPVWVAHCPELDIVSQGFSSDEARAMLQEAVEGFLEVASPSEVEARLAEGYTPTVEPLKVAA